MGPLLHHPALIDDVDHVRLLDGAQPVGDGDGGAALRGRVQGRLDHLFRLRVQRRRRFVEEEDFGVAQEGSGDGDALLLAAGEEAAFGADDGGEAVAGGDVC